jgi:cysteinyl-tRNA synthetase
MNHKLFGDVIDIHGGGMDLKFPHHENEIAQAEAAYGTHLAKYWIHVGRLDLNGVKMSKSLGNVIYVKDIDNTHDGMVLRCLILFSPYRQMIPYSMDLFNQYAKEYDKWVRAYKQCLFELQYKGLLSDSVDSSDIDEFKKYMDDDFNVQNVLTLINNIVKAMNTSLRAKDYDTLALKLHTLEVILDVLHINLFVDKMTEEELAVYKEWQEARLNKDFEKADIARAKLVEWKLV